MKKGLQFKGYEFVDPFDSGLSKDKFIQWLYDKAMEDSYILSDTETDGLRWYQGNNIIGVNIGFKNHKIATFLPLESCVKAPGFFSKKQVLELQEECTKDKWIIGQNYPFDYTMFLANGVDLYDRKIIDTTLLAYTDNENRMLTEYKLENLCTAIYPDAAIFEERLLKIQSKKDGLANAPWRELFNYSCGDLANTGNLFDYQFERLKERGLLKYGIELSRYGIDLAVMAFYGVKLDKDRLSSLQTELQEYCDSIWKEELVPGYKTKTRIVNNKFGFNPNSSKEVAEKYKLPNAQKATLELYAGTIPEVAEIMQYKKCSTYKGTFTKNLLEFLDPNDYIRPNYSIVKVRTPRISCSDPNLMNIPERSDPWGIKDTFICEEDEIFVKFDYSQIELRMLAHLSGEEVLVDNYLNGGDIHAQTMRLLNCERVIAKNVNFGLPFGMGITRFAYGYLGGDIKLATDLHRDYGKKHPKVKRFYRLCEAVAREHGMIKYWTGNYRHFTGIEHLVHTAMPNIVQGSAGEIYRIAINRCVKTYRLDKNFALPLQVHDELLFRLPKNGWQDYISSIVEKMTDFNFIVPIEVDCKIGSKWGSCKEIDLKEYIGTK